MSTTLTVTAKGQVTFRKDILEHLGVRPGDKITIDKLGDGRITARAERAKHPIADVFGMLNQPDGLNLTIEEIKEATERAWAGER